MLGNPMWQGTAGDPIAEGGLLQETEGLGTPTQGTESYQQPGRVWKWSFSRGASDETTALEGTPIAASREFNQKT